MKRTICTDEGIFFVGEEKLNNDKSIKWRAFAFTAGFVFLCVFGLIIPWLYGVILLIKKIF